MKQPATWGKRSVNPRKLDGKKKRYRPDASPSLGGPLRDLLTSSLPDATQVDAVQTCLEHVQILACQLLGDTSAVVVQGSYAQGLALRGSDLDIAVILPEDSSKSSKNSSSKRRAEVGEDVVRRQQALHCLQRLAQALSEAKLDEIRIALKIFSAKVPVLRLHCGAKGERNVVVDVSVGGSLLRGACDRAVYSVLQKDNSRGIASALCRLVKLWAKRRKLTNTLRGGLSSFSFVLLTIFFLQRSAATRCSLPSQVSVTGTRAKPADPENCCPEPLGLELRVSEEELIEVFAEFFKWATEELPKFRNCTMSIGSGTAERRTGRFHPLILEVPFSSEENAARCLRIDVWEGSILPELHRANHLVKQLGGCKGRARASVVQALFSASVDVEVFEAPAPVASAPDETALNTSDHDDGPEVEAEETKSARRSAKRRRKMERNKLRRSRPQEFSKVIPETVAPVDRWLGLRSLLDPR